MDMFVNAPKAPSKSAGKAKSDILVKKVEGIHLYAALKAVKTNVEAQIAVVESEIKAQMTDHFVDEGMKIDRRPANYKGTDSGSEASLQLKTSPSAINEEAQKLLGEKKIPLTKSVAQHATFIVNPAYADLSNERNAAMLTKVSEALMELGLPVDFFQQQDEVSKVVADEDSIHAVMALESKSDVAALLPLVSCLAIKATLAEDANPFEIVEDALGSPEAEDTAAA